jgi:hybrid cluster-associated redox disulfide protein
MSEPAQGTPLPAQLREMTVSDLLQEWPETIPVFHRHQMACPGCAVAPFYTVDDAAAVYGVETEGFVAELVAAISEGGEEA